MDDFCKALKFTKVYVEFRREEKIPNFVEQKKAAERKEKYKSGRRNRYKVVKYHGIQYERKLTS